MTENEPQRSYGANLEIDFVSMVVLFNECNLKRRACLSQMKSIETTEPNLARTFLAVRVNLPSPQSPLIAGTYALVGARLFNPLPRSKRVSMIVDMGNDFPSSAFEMLTQLNCSILFRSTPERWTTRGYNVYGPGELRSTSHLEGKN